mmetsp:Transcript_45589/g.108452  ORF Transcript_45589/g.108452 Transcript_45589/m.108452 type:complete len:687 (-) Transcript_45589:182-2242(-)
MGSYAEDVLRAPSLGRRNIRGDACVSIASSSSTSRPQLQKLALAGAQAKAAGRTWSTATTPIMTPQSTYRQTGGSLAGSGAPTPRAKASQETRQRPADQSAASPTSSRRSSKDSSCGAATQKQMEKPSPLTPRSVWTPRPERKLRVSETSTPSQQKSSPSSAAGRHGMGSVRSASQSSKHLDSPRRKPRAQAVPGRHTIGSPDRPQSPESRDKSPVSSPPSPRKSRPSSVKSRNGTPASSPLRRNSPQAAGFFRSKSTGRDRGDTGGTAGDQSAERSKVQSARREIVTDVIYIPQGPQSKSPSPRSAVASRNGSATPRAVVQRTRSGQQEGVRRNLSPREVAKVQVPSAAAAERPTVDDEPDRRCPSRTSAFTIADAALEKSEQLLQQLSTLDLSPQPASEEEDAEDSESAESPMLRGDSKSLPIPGPAGKTIEVPIELVKELAEVWRRHNASAESRGEDGKGTHTSFTKFLQAHVHGTHVGGPPSVSTKAPSSHGWQSPASSQLCGNGSFGSLVNGHSIAIPTPTAVSAGALSARRDAGSLRTQAQASGGTYGVPSSSLPSSPAVPHQVSSVQTLVQQRSLPLLLPASGSNAQVRPTRTVIKPPTAGVTRTSTSTAFSHPPRSKVLSCPSSTVVHKVPSVSASSLTSLQNSQPQPKLVKCQSVVCTSIYHVYTYQTTPTASNPQG